MDPNGPAPGTGGFTMPQLMLGQKGDAVRELQQALLDQGYTLPKHGADGQLGHETFAAAQKYAEDHHLAWPLVIPASVVDAILRRVPPGPAPERTRVEIPGGICVTIWNGNGPLSVWADPKTVALLEAARPPLVQVHSSPPELRQTGPQVTKELREKLVGVGVWWGIAGDAFGGDTVAQQWLDTARCAADAGVEVLILNCEEAWKRPDHAGVATRAIAALRRAFPEMKLGHTAYAWPAAVKVGSAWWGHEEYPWKEFLGDDGCDWSHPQIYWNAQNGTAPRGRGAVYLNVHRTSWTAAEKKGLIRRNLPMGVYLAAFGCDVADLCTVAQSFQSVCIWAVPQHDAHGGAAIRALCELHRRGFDGPGSIVRFQEERGLTADGIIGKMTLKELGIEF